MIYSNGNFGEECNIMNCCFSTDEESDRFPGYGSKVMIIIYNSASKSMSPPVGSIWCINTKLLAWYSGDEHDVTCNSRIVNE